MDPDPEPDTHPHPPDESGSRTSVTEYPHWTSRLEMPNAKSQSIWYTLNFFFFLICPFCQFCIYRNAEFFKFLFYLNKLPLKNCLFFYLDAKEIVEQSNNKVVVEKETSERMPAKILSTEPVGHWLAISYNRGYWEVRTWNQCCWVYRRHHECTVVLATEWWEEAPSNKILIRAFSGPQRIISQDPRPKGWVRHLRMVKAQTYC